MYRVGTGVTMFPTAIVGYLFGGDCFRGSGSMVIMIFDCASDLLAGGDGEILIRLTTSANGIVCIIFASSSGAAVTKIIRITQSFIIGNKFVVI